MYTIKHILEQDKLELLLKAAKELGFRELRLFKPDVDGILGIYAEFDDNVREQYDSRSLALTYKFSELTRAQVVVVSNQNDIDNSIKKNSLSFEEVRSARFKEIFSKSSDEINIESSQNFSYQSKMDTYKILYERLNDLKADKKADFQGSAESNLYTPSYVKPNEKTKSTQNNKRKWPELPSEIKNFITIASSEDFSEFLDFIKKIRNKSNFKHLK